MVDGYTLDRLDNWSAWARSGRIRSGRCQSAEWRYVPERLAGDNEADRRTPRGSIDVRDAMTVETAINPTSGRLRRHEYLVLCAYFVHRLRGYDLAGFMRRRGVPVGRSANEHQALVSASVAAARRALERPEIAWSVELRYNQPRHMGDGSGPQVRLSASLVSEGSLVD